MEVPNRCYKKKKKKKPQSEIVGIEDVLIYHQFDDCMSSILRSFGPLRDRGEANG